MKGILGSGRPEGVGEGRVSPLGDQAIGLPDNSIELLQGVPFTGKGSTQPIDAENAEERRGKHRTGLVRYPFLTYFLLGPVFS